MAVDALLVSALSLAAGGVWPLGKLATLLGFCGGLAVLARSLGVRGVLVCVALFGLGALRASSGLNRYDTARFAFRDALGHPRRCALEAEVASSPVELGGSLSFVAEVQRADCEGVVVRDFRSRLYGGLPDLARGDRFNAVADLAAIQQFRNFGAADPRPGGRRSFVVASGGLLSLSREARGWGIGQWIDRARAHVRARIEATFPTLAVPLSRALVLGESDLDPDDDAAFRQSGLSHLLAVSGTHLVLAVVTLVNLLAFALVRIEAFAACVRVARVAAGLGIALSLAYADFAGGSGSAFRAAYMLAAGFFVTAAGRRPSPLRCLAASIFIGALLDPLVACDVSFMLSVAATAGLIGLGPRFARAVSWVRPSPLAWLARSLSTTLSAMLPCVPLLALLSPSLGGGGLLANVVAGPLGELCALPLCLGHAVLGFSSSLERGAALGGGGALLLVRAVARFTAAHDTFRLTLPAPSGLELGLIAPVLAGFSLFRGSWKGWLWLAFGGLLLALLELEARRAGAPEHLLRATVLDVGQGDSTLLDLPDGSLWLVDGGGFVGSPVDPGRSVILPELRARRRRRIDVMVLTHPHPDHFTGLESVLESVEVGEFWDTGQGLAQGAGPVYARIRRLLQARGVKVRGPSELCGRRSVGGVLLEVLSPCPDFRTELGANDNSFVVRLSYGQRAFLLTGDAEHAAEERLLASAAPLRADFLKVGHHGSRTSSSPAFLDAVQPSIATLSTGVRNRFGHPHAITLQKLSERGIAALRTDRFGAVQITTDGASLTRSSVADGR